VENENSTVHRPTPLFHDDERLSERERKRAGLRSAEVAEKLLQPPRLSLRRSQAPSTGYRAPCLPLTPQSEGRAAAGQVQPATRQLSRSPATSSRSLRFSSSFLYSYRALRHLKLSTTSLSSPFAEPHTLISPLSRIPSRSSRCSTYTVAGLVPEAILSVCCYSHHEDQAQRLLRHWRWIRIGTRNCP
jgi:hypothetical protein